ncbi:inter-alpha-trypsin inhibitor heavy chain H3-like [Styela clava]
MKTMKLKHIFLCLCYTFLTSEFIDAQLCHEKLGAEWKRNTFSTPGFPIPYIGNLNCSWVIVAEAGTQIELKFFIVDLEPEYDTLKIYDGKDETAPLLSVLHGRIHVPEAIISSVGFLFLRFTSDDSVSKRGFRAQYRFALSSKMNVTTVIQSCLADTTISKEVYNSDTVPREVEFKVVFPHDAYVTEFEMTVGGVKYFGQVERKESVKQKYDKVDVQWVSMGYVSSTKDLAKRFFTGILLKPKETVKFEIIYQQLLQRRLGRYTNTVVLTRDFLLSDLNVDVYICARSKLSFLQVPPMEDAGGMSYMGQVRFLGRRDNFPSDVKVEKEENVAHISYRSSRKGRVDPIKVKRSVFVTHYDVDREDHGALSVFGGEYFATFFSPVSPNLVRRIVFVLDVSGSMAGNKIKQVKKAMKNILSRLTRRDSFNIVQFESVVRKWRPVGLVAATPEAKISANKYIDSFDPEGKTNIHEALITGIKLLSSGKTGASLRRTADVNPYRDFVFFLGDGKPTVGVRNPTSILRSVRSANRRGYGINAIGFGKNVDVPFLQRITRENSGKWRIIYDDEDSHVQIQNFITELGVPIMTDVTFNYSPKQVNFTTRRRNLVLVNGGEVGVFGRLLPNLTDEYMNVTVTGKTFKRVSNTFSFPLNRNTTQCNSISEKLVDEFVGRGYGIAKLEETLRRLRESTDEDENVALTDEATDISLEFNLVTPVTSLVVKKQNQTKEREKTEKPKIEETINRGSKEPRSGEPIEPGEIIDELPGVSKPWVFEGDPHFIVALGNNITVCFTWNGTDGQIYNLLNDPISGITLNGLIKYGPRSPDSESKNNCAVLNITKRLEFPHSNKNEENKTCNADIESFFVKLGFVFPKERIKIEVTTREVRVRDERNQKNIIKEVFPTSDDNINIVRGSIGIKAYNITKVHSFVNITLNGTITFIINQKRGRNLPKDKKRTTLIDHLDLDIVGHQNLSPYTGGLFGVFPTDVKRDLKKKKKGNYPVARLRRPGKENLLQYRQHRISVDKISIDDPFSKVPRECWFTYEENLVTGKPDDAFKVKNIFSFPKKEIVKLKKMQH